MLKNKMKLLIYPYGEQACPIIRHMDLIQDYELVSVVSPPGWGLSGNDAGSADNGGNIGIFVSDDFNEALKLCDTVLFIDSNRAFDFKKYIYPKICSSIENNKNILIAENIDNDMECTIRKMCNDKGLCFKYFGIDRNKSSECYILKENLLNIEVPVVFVIGMAENTDKFETQLSIREELLKTGYKISQVATRSYSGLFGIHNFPHFMFDEKLSEVKKILMFNRFIWEIEINEKPDIIVVGIPGGIIPFNNNFTNRFGILAIEASIAVKPDVAILCIPFGDYQKDSYTKFTNVVKYKLGYSVDAIVLSNVLPEWPIISQGIEMSYMRVSSDFTTSNKKIFDDFDVPINNIFNKNDVFKLVEQIIDKLTEYGEMGVI